MSAVVRSMGLGLVLLAALCGAGLAQAAGFDAAGFDAWLDRSFGEAYRQGGAFGAMAVVVVQGDQVVVTRSFGPARRAPDVAIDPATTRLLIGSATKTFTGLAIAQLVERGRIASIDEPANKYLKRLQIGGPWGQQVTIRHLLTHSAGYDGRFRGTGSFTPVATPLDGATIERLAPNLVRPPGELVSYSNYSTGLLAALVEDLTGQDIEAYLKANVWQPLGMKTAAFEKGPAPAADVALAYQKEANGSWKAADFIPFHPFFWPVGAMALSLQDVAAYMRFHLTAARGVDQPVLGAAMHRQLRARLAANHPALGGFGFQMMSFRWNDRELFGHGGTWPGYESMMILSPQDDLGVFFAITGPSEIGNMVATGMVLRQLFGPWQGGPGEASGASALAGTWRPTLRATRGIEAVLGFAGNGNGVAVRGDGSGLFLGEDGAFAPAGKDLFVKPDAKVSASNPFGSPVFGVKRDAAGQATHLVDVFGLVPLERTPSWAAPALRVQAFGGLQILLTLLGLAALAWPRKGAVNRFGIAAALLPALGLWVFWPVLGVAPGPGGVAGVVIAGGPGRFQAMAMIGNVTLACGLFLAWLAWHRWRAGDARPKAWVRWHGAVLALLVLAAAALLASMGATGWV